MKRFRQPLPDAEAAEIVTQAANGVLPLIDTDRKPYGVPLSFVFDVEGHIYFHSALTGGKRTA